MESGRWTCSRPAAVALMAAVMALLLCGPRPGEAAPDTKAARDEALRIITKEAFGAYKKGDFIVASSLFLRAWKMDPTDARLLYSAARAEQEMGALGKASAHLGELIERYPKVPVADKARKIKRQIDAELAQRAARPPPKATAPPAPNAAAQPAPNAAAQPPGPSPGPADAGIGRETPEPSSPPTARWMLLGGGALVTAVGATVLGIAMADHRDLESARGEDGRLYQERFVDLRRHERIATLDDYNAAIRSANTRLYTGWIMTALGAAAAGTGALLLAISDDASATLAPMPTGVALAVRF